MVSPVEMFFNDHRKASSRLMERSFNQGPLRPEQVRRRRQNGGTGMMMRIFGRARFAAFMVAALAVAGCASKATDNLAGVAGAAAPGSPQDFVVNVGDRVFFETDSTDLTPQSRSTLDKQAQWLQQYNRYAFTIEGHADERGTREYNIALGARRAQTVRDYLSARGISPSRMRTISYGKERPVAVCDDISCWSQNRRAVTVLNSNQS
jgi:peptidoglycan-associated lipoprotein